MNSLDTIFAPATPPGPGTRVLIRVSGPRCTQVLAASAPGEAFARGIARGRIPLPARGQSGPPASELPVLLLLLPGPASYTGEHTLELLMPAHPSLVDRVLTWLSAIPPAPGDVGHMRLAQPGEFSARAFLAGKLSLAQAEAVAAIIAATTHDQLVAAKHLMQGTTGALYRAWADELTMLVALVEAGIDFTDQEDVVPIAPAALHARILALVETIASHTLRRAASEAGSQQALPKVVLVGPPNAGKSTLFNALLGRTRAVASPVAGTTRDVLAEELNLANIQPGSGTILLHDLPGLDAHTTSPADQAAQCAARDAIAQADLIIRCEPRGAGRLVTPALAAPVPTGIPVITVQTFADRPLGVGQAGSDLAVCALDGYNLASLKRALADQTCATSSASLATLLPRHRRALDWALASLTAAASLVDADAHALASPETVAEQLRGGLQALGELVGAVSPDDIIGRIFATFCVGK